MRHRLPHIILAIALVALAACTRPIDADFEGNDPGLKDEELFWVLRVPSQVSVLPWKPVMTSADSIEIETFNLPVFEQVMPLLIGDLMEGGLTAYEDIEFSEEEKPITDLKERVARMSGTADFQPYSKAFEVLAVVRSANGAYNSEVKYLRLLWRDPKNPTGERTLACVRVDDLNQFGYEVELGGSKLPFIEYLRREPFYSYPLYVRSNQVEHRLGSAAEAGYLKSMVRSGNWDQVRWIDGSINISGLTWVKLEQRQLKGMSGVFVFPPMDSLSGSRVLYLETAEDYLLADWTHKFRNEKVFPFDSVSCFNTGGELLFFYRGEDSNLDSILFISGPDTLLGHRTRTL